MDSIERKWRTDHYLPILNKDLTRTQAEQLGFHAQRNNVPRDKNPLTSPMCFEWDRGWKRAFRLKHGHIAYDGLNPTPQYGMPDFE